MFTGGRAGNIMVSERATNPFQFLWFFFCIMKTNYLTICYNLISTSFPPSIFIWSFQCGFQIVALLNMNWICKNPPGIFLWFSLRYLVTIATIWSTLSPSKAHFVMMHIIWALCVSHFTMYYLAVVTLTLLFYYYSWYF